MQYSKTIFDYPVEELARIETLMAELVVSVIYPFFPPENGSEDNVQCFIEFDPGGDLAAVGGLPDLSEYLFLVSLTWKEDKIQASTTLYSLRHEPAKELASVSREYSIYKKINRSASNVGKQLRKIIEDISLTSEDA